MTLNELERPSDLITPANLADVKPLGFDAAGDYDQDSINGITPDILDDMLNAAQFEPGQKILDCMSGNGNLSQRILDYYSERGWDTPDLSCLEFSEVQSAFAEAALEEQGVTVIWGDALTMQNLETGTALASESFDRILIKSANHEIPANKQLALYQQIFRLLKPGGIFVNLGMVFDNAGSRDDVQATARVKDYYAGMHSNIINRHFLTRDELEHGLSKAGFNTIEKSRSFDYTIKSDVIATQYFPPKLREEGNRAWQTELLFCDNLRQENRVIIRGSEATMLCPGEVTVAFKHSAQEDNETLFAKYPYHFLRKIAVHRELLKGTKAHIPANARVLDLACGMGLLAEHIADDVEAYRGVDFNRDFITMCEAKLGDHDSLEFYEGDIHALGKHKDFKPDTITILNALYIAGMKPNKIMKQVKKMLAPGGTLVVSGPVSQKAFERVLPHIVKQLQDDGEYDQEAVNAIAQANAALLTADCNYWSAEGMVALLMQHGFQIVEATMDHYHGNCFKVVATH